MKTKNTLSECICPTAAILR